MSEEKKSDAKKELLYSKGYHIASKYILCDPEITIAAKAIYCYLRSLCRDDFSHRVFPSVERQLADLGMSKKLYYKARAELLKAGIIIISRHKNNGEFDNNTYEFPLQPSKYMVDRKDEPFAKWLPFIRSRGVLIAFGFAPFLLMSYEGLDFKAKVFAVYISAHAKNELENPYAELNPQLIMYHLGIKESSYKKYLAQLKDHGFVFVERMRDAGKLCSVSRYGLIENGPYGAGVGKQKSDVVTFIPKSSEPTGEKENTVDAPTGKKEDTVDAPTGAKEDTVDTPTGEKEDVVNAPTGEKETAAIEAAVKDTTTNTRFTTTSSNKILFDGLIRTVRKKISYRVFEIAGEDTPQILKAADLLVDTIVHALASPNPVIIINGEPYTAEFVQEILMQVNNVAAMNVLNRYLAKEDSIHNKSSYLLTSIYNEIQTPSKEVEDYEKAY